MMKRSTLFLGILFILFLTSCAQSSKHDYVVTIKTPYGDMVAILYDETPQHKQNFIKLAKEGFYDSLLFHRVMKGFMIQGGDPNSKNAKPNQPLGNGGPGYETVAEFNPKFFHKKGALSAARRGPGNPEKKSSGSQFYVVQGNKMTDEELTQLEESIKYQRKNENLRTVLGMPECADVRQLVIEKQRANDGEWLQSFFQDCDTLIQQHVPGYIPFKFSDAQRAAYKEVGGAPHLDGDYTVFGQVIQGLEVVDKIADQPVGAGNRPTEDIRMQVTVEEMSKRKIEKQYGYTYPD